ncbi:MAG: hypothetical protein ACYCV5_14105 [Acidimicrobiales bacterium]
MDDNLIARRIEAAQVLPPPAAVDDNLIARRIEAARTLGFPEAFFERRVITQWISGRAHISWVCGLGAGQGADPEERPMSLLEAAAAPLCTESICWATFAAMYTGKDQGALLRQLRFAERAVDLEAACAVAVSHADTGNCSADDYTALTDTAFFIRELRMASRTPDPCDDPSQAQAEAAFEAWVARVAALLVVATSTDAYRDRVLGEVARGAGAEDCDLSYHEVLAGISPPVTYMAVPRYLHAALDLFTVATGPGGTLLLVPRFVLDRILLALRQGEDEAVIVQTADPAVLLDLAVTDVDRFCETLEGIWCTDREVLSLSGALAAAKAVIATPAPTAT